MDINDPFHPLNPTIGPWFNPANPYYYIYGAGANHTTEVTQSDIEDREAGILGSLVVITIVIILLIPFLLNKLMDKHVR